MDSKSTNDGMTGRRDAAEASGEATGTGAAAASESGEGKKREAPDSGTPATPASAADMGRGADAWDSDGQAAAAAAAAAGAWGEVAGGELLGAAAEIGRGPVTTGRGGLAIGLGPAAIGPGADAGAVAPTCGASFRGELPNARLTALTGGSDGRGCGFGESTGEDGVEVMRMGMGDESESDFLIRRRRIGTPPAEEEEAAVAAAAAIELGRDAPTEARSAASLASHACCAFFSSRSC